MEVGAIAIAPAMLLPLLITAIREGGRKRGSGTSRAPGSES